MAAKRQAPPSLHELESEVMEEVWRRDRELTVRQVLESLNQGERQRAYTTIMTIMARLDKKGLLRRRRRGKTDLYLPVMSRDEYVAARARSEVDGLVADFGDVALAHFARQIETLDSKRRAQLKKLAEESG